MPIAAGKAQEAAGEAGSLAAGVIAAPARSGACNFAGARVAACILGHPAHPGPPHNPSTSV
ncbi:hypothetical protein [Azospirillum palustre]